MKITPENLNDYIRYLYETAYIKEPYDTDLMISLRKRLYDRYSCVNTSTMNSVYSYYDRLNSFGYKVNNINVWLRDKKVNEIIG